MKWIVAAAFSLALWFFPKSAEAIVCPIAHTFTTSEILTQAVLNANPVQENICFANLDYRNIGATGIFASQIRPSTVAQAIFGGSSGYTFNVPSGSQVQLTVLGASGQSADLFDVTTATGATPSLQVNSAGQANLTSGLHVGPTASITAPNVGDAVFERGSGAGYAWFGSGLSASIGWNGTFFVTSGNYPFIATAGLLTSNQTGSATQSWVPPYYTINGAAQNNTLHGVIWTCTFSSASFCNVTISGTGNAFNNGYTCSADLGSATSTAFLPWIGNKTSTSFTVYTQPTTVTSTTVTGQCIGV